MALSGVVIVFGCEQFINAPPPILLKSECSSTVVSFGRLQNAKFLIYFHSIFILIGSMYPLPSDGASLRKVGLPLIPLIIIFLTIVCYKFRFLIFKKSISMISE